jgi:hypothetical protein
MRISPFLVAFATLSPAGARAQESDAQLWTATTANFDLDGDTTFSAQFVSRFSDEAGGLFGLQISGDVDVKVGAGFSLGGGYSYVPRYEQGRLVAREHRIRQQASVALGEALGGRVDVRLRLEERWRERADDVLLRLRVRIGWTRPIGPDGLALRLTHESFAHLNESDWGGPARYDQMRNQVALRRKLGGVLSGEIGYLNQYAFEPNGPDAIAHALTLGVTFDF